MRFLRFLFGGTLYCLIEVLWRGFTHITMFFLGGSCFWLLSGIGRLRIPFWRRTLIGAAAVTASEFVAGLILNRLLHLGVWDYSSQPFHLLGQICPLFAIFWIPLCAAGIFLNGIIDRSVQPSGRRRAAL